MNFGCIYKISNLENGKIYVGQTIQKPENREYGHFYNLKRQSHHNNHLQSDFNRYGESNFKFSILTWATSNEELDKLEKYFIKKYNALNIEKGYNVHEGGSFINKRFVAQKSIMKIKNKTVACRIHKHYSNLLEELCDIHSLSKNQLLNNMIIQEASNNGLDVEGLKVY